MTSARQRTCTKPPVDLVPLRVGPARNSNICARVWEAVRQEGFVVLDIWPRAPMAEGAYGEIEKEIQELLEERHWISG